MTTDFVGSVGESMVGRPLILTLVFSCPQEGIHFMALISHQGSLQSLPYDPILFDLRETPGGRSGVELTANMSLFIASSPVDTWLEQIEALNTVNYE